MADIDFTRMNEEIQAMADKFGLSSESLANFVKITSKSTKEFKKQIDELNKEVKKGKKTYEDQKKLIEDLNDAIEELGDTTNDQVAADKKNALIAERNALQFRASSTKTSESLEKFGEALGKSAIVGAGNFVRQLQNNASAAEIASGIWTIGIDAVAAGAGVAGAALQSAGAAAVYFLPGWYKVIGLVLNGLGGIVSASGGVAASLAKFGIEILNKEVDKTIKSFNTISMTGATFSNGLTGMRDAAASSRLTVEQFSTVISANASNISLAGLGYTDTLKKLSGVQSKFAAGTNSTRLQLLKLGYSFEDQASLVLETMADMRRGGLLRGATDEQIGQQTKEYAQNLRIISAVTGEDAKKKMDESRKLMMNSAIQAKILENQKRDPNYARKLQAQLAEMLPEFHTAYLQKVSGLGVIDPLSSVMMANVPQLEESMNRMLAVLNDGTTNATDANVHAANQRAIAGKAISKNSEMMTIFGQIAQTNATGLATEMNTMMAGIMDKAGGLELGVGDKALAGVHAQQKATDGLTTSLMHASEEAQKLAEAFQAKILPLLTGYAEVTDATMKMLDKYLVDSGIYDKGKTTVNKEEASGFISRNGSWNEKIDNFATDIDIYLEKWAGLDKKADYDAQERANKATALALELNTKAIKEEQQLTTSAPAKVNDYMGGITAHAKGGSIKAGAIGLVGEEGPELITGPTAVTPNKATTEILKVLTALADFKNDKFSNKYSADASADTTRPQDLRNTVGLAKNGIMSSGLSGFQADLHAPEVAEKLPENKPIPVKLDSSSLTATLHEQTGLLNSILASLNKGNSLSSGILQNSY